MSQLTQWEYRRLTNIENKNGNIDGADARIGWVTFSKTGHTLYYRDIALRRVRAAE